MQLVCAGLSPTWIDGDTFRPTRALASPRFASLADPTIFVFLDDPQDIVGRKGLYRGTGQALPYEH